MFAEPGRSHDPIALGTQYASDNAVYAQVAELLETRVVSFPHSRAADDALFGLADAYGARSADVAAAIKTAGRIVFHALGDTGSSDARKCRNELRVADQLSIDCATDEAGNRPAFLFHLGNVIYCFGESCYHYDQFYDPYRAYPAPVVAAPGNHDFLIVSDTPPGEEPPPPSLAPSARRSQIRPRGRAAASHGHDAVHPSSGLSGCSATALEDPGLISSEGSRWPGVPDAQL